MREYERRSRWTPRHVLAVVLILVVLAVLLLFVYRSTERSREVEAEATPTSTAIAGATAEPKTALSNAPAASGQPGRTEAPPARTQAPATQPPVAAEPTPKVTFSETEESLVHLVRQDAAVSCSPRRTDLPPGATAAIECRPGTQPLPGWEHLPYGIAERVGVYKFESDAAAAVVYLDRMTQAGVTLGHGDCWAGTAGDEPHVWGDAESVTRGDHPEVEYHGEVLNAWRFGCFVNENAIANVRVTCGDGIYLGILGRIGDLAALTDWSWASPPHVGADTGFAYPPGICLGSN
jgi:hypothetical protein